MPIIQQDPGGDFLNAFLAAYGVSNQAQNQKFERKRQQQQDQENAALTAAQVGETRARTSASGYNPDTGEPIASSVQYDTIPSNAPPDKIFEIATRNLAKAASSHDQQGVKDWGALAQQSSLGYERTTMAQYTAGPRTQQAEATTAEIKAKTKNIEGQFAHDIDMLKLRGANAQQVAAIHAAYRRAGGGSSASSGAAQRAMIAAMNEAERQHVNVQNSEMLKTYYTQQALHDKDPDTYAAPDQPQLQTAPVITVNAQGQPIVVQVPGAQPSAPAPKPQAAQPSAPQTSGGNPFSGLIRGVENFLHIGGGSTPQRIVQHNIKTGQYRHSDDGGKTWQPGP